MTDTHLCQTHRKFFNLVYRSSCSITAIIISKVKNHFISFVIAIAEVYKNEGNDEYNKKNFNNAIHFYTEGIKVNCKDEDLNAKLYSNRATAHFNLGKSCYILAFKYLIFGLLN